ncbi:MAG: hypothetical protein AB1589_22800 [Cyanobacteriota bacterium]
MPDVPRNLSHIYGVWSQGYPLYCVRPNLLEQILETDVGENLALFADINLAIPSYILFLPQYQIKSPFGKGYIDYLVVHHEELELPEHKYAIAWGGVDSSEGLFLAYKRIRRDGTLQRSHLGDGSEEQKQQSLLIRNIVLQSILLLQYYPEIEDQITVTPGKEKGFSKPKAESEFLLPRWLGKESTSSTSSSTGKKGASKATHFRRGHWRAQSCGKGRTETRITWVRPAWVAANS